MRWFAAEFYLPARMIAPTPVCMRHLLGGQQQDHGSRALARAFELCRRSRRKHRRVRHPLNSGDAYTSTQVAGEQRVSSEPSSYFLTILSAIPTAIGTLKVSCL